LHAKLVPLHFGQIGSIGSIPPVLPIVCRRTWIYPAGPLSVRLSYQDSWPSWPGQYPTDVSTPYTLRGDMTSTCAVFLRPAHSLSGHARQATRGGGLQTGFRGSARSLAARGRFTLFATAAAALPPRRCPRPARGRLTLFAIGLPARASRGNLGAVRGRRRSVARNVTIPRASRGHSGMRLGDGIGHVGGLQIGQERDRLNTPDQSAREIDYLLTWNYAHLCNPLGISCSVELASHRGPPPSIRVRLGGSPPGSYRAR
jgi:hypothetical protein